MTLTAKELWQLHPEEFNNWRSENDFPKLVTILHEKLPLFESWQNEFDITINNLVKHGPARYLKESSIAYIYIALKYLQVVLLKLQLTMKDMRLVIILRLFMMALLKE